jgi:hypothetical protein
VINEIMYAPMRYSMEPNTLEEYVEIWNTGNVTVPLYDPAYPTNAWEIGGGIQFSFPPGFSLGPGAYLLLVSFDPEQDPAALEWFRTRYGLSNNVTIIGPFSGTLANEGERVTLYKPDVPEIAPSPVVGFVPSIMVEEVLYSPSAPWPAGTLEFGKSLQRVRAQIFGNDPANWEAAVPTPGAANPSVSNSDADHDGLPDAWETANGFDPADSSGVNGATGDPDADGAANLAEYIAGTNPRNPNDYLAFETVGYGQRTCVEFHCPIGTHLHRGGPRRSRRHSNVGRAPVEYHGQWRSNDH